MTFLQNGNRRRASYIPPLILLIALSGLIFVPPVRSLIATAAHGLGSGLWHVRNEASVGTARQAAVLQSKRSLILENEELRTTIASVEPMVARLSALEEENKQLRQELLWRTGEELIAPVLAHPPMSLYDTLIVRTTQSVPVGALVRGEQYTLLGSVVRTLSSSAVVRLYSAPGEKTEAILLSSNVPVTLLGRGGGTFEFRLPKDAPVATGDVVTMPGTQGVIAVVGTVVSRETQPFKEILAKVPLNLFTLSNVRIEL